MGHHHHSSTKVCENDTVRINISGRDMDIHGKMVAPEFSHGGMIIHWAGKGSVPYMPLVGASCKSGHTEIDAAIAKKHHAHVI